MHMIKIWERYFAVQFLKSVLLLLFGFYSLYILIDYSTHASLFSRYHQHSFWHDITVYYLSEFINRFNVIAPFAVLIASIKTLCTLNTNNELVALMASGVTVKKLLRPFILLGLAFTAITYLNTQFLQPNATTQLKVFSEDRKSLKKNKIGIPSVENLVLADNSTLIYRSYDSSKQRFFDAYWIRSIDDIYRIQYLYPYTEIPRGDYVEHLARNDTGLIVEKESLRGKDFPEMRFHKKRLMESTTQPDELSLTELWQKIPVVRDCKSEKEAGLLTTFYLKMTLPWLCLLAVMGPAPYCITFSRSLPTFLIYATATFGLVAIYLIMQAAEVLAKRQVFDPFLGVTLPFLGFLIPILWKYIRTR